MLTPEHSHHLLELQANLQSTISRLLAENARLVEELQQPCDSCAQRAHEEADRVADALDAQRNRNRDESNALPPVPR